MTGVSGGSRISFTQGRLPQMFCGGNLLFGGLGRVGAGRGREVQVIAIEFVLNGRSSDEDSNFKSTCYAINFSHSCIFLIEINRLISVITHAFGFNPFFHVVSQIRS